MMSDPAKVSTATVLPLISEEAIFRPTCVPSCLRSSNALGAIVTGPLKLTVRRVTIERWAEPSLTTMPVTVINGPDTGAVKLIFSAAWGSAMISLSAAVLLLWIVTPAVSSYS